MPSEKTGKQPYQRGPGSLLACEDEAVSQQTCWSTERQALCWGGSVGGTQNTASVPETLKTQRNEFLLFPRFTVYSDHWLGLSVFSS